jgi:hypothetical protein
MKERLSESNPRPGGLRRESYLSRWRALLLILLLPLVLGGWRVISGETINPNLVKRIKNGQTTKNEILVFFGDPQEIKRTPEGVVYIYRSYKDAPAMPYNWMNRDINPQSDQPMVIGADKQIKKAPLKTKGKILRSTLTVHFKSDGDTVMSHEYKEYKDKK